jgi:hypothetical protein
VSIFVPELKAVVFDSSQKSKVSINTSTLNASAFNLMDDECDCNDSNHFYLVYSYEEKDSLISHMQSQATSCDKFP